jgi:hypothetical protein
MSTKSFPRKESIRVAPLKQPKAKISLDELFRGHKGKAPAAAKLTYRGGPLIPNVEVFTIFWGKGWSSAPLKPLADNLNKFFSAIVKSNLMIQMSEYNVPKYKIGNGKLSGSIVISAGAPAHSITDSQIQKQLGQWIKTKKSFPKPGKNTLYFIYFDRGVSVSMGGSKSCSSFCGYHDSIGKGTYYSVMPYPGCAGCLGGLSVLDALTGTSSHELCEAITDPVPGSGWYDDHNGEIGDICAWQFRKIAGYEIQLEWSNKNNKCM